MEGGRVMVEGKGFRVSSTGEEREYRQACSRKERICKWESPFGRARRDVTYTNQMGNKFTVSKAFYFSSKVARLFIKDTHSTARDTRGC